MVSLCVVSGGPAWDLRTQNISQLLECPYELSHHEEEDNKEREGFRKKIDFFLNVSETLSLQTQAGLTLEIDFDHDHIHYEKKQIGKKNILARALGIEKDVTEVTDLSCGLGCDAVMLAQIGFQIRANERNRVLWILLTEAQKKSNQELIHKIEFSNQESIDLLAASSIADLRSRAFYFDPMFPEKKKGALPRKEMQIFRDLVGEDEDSTKVVSMAAELKVARLVVKRPIKALPLLEKPRYSIEGKLLRFDVYQF